MRLTPPFNLPAPGRRQCLYVVLTTLQTPVFLLNSRLRRFSAAHVSSPREVVHLPWAPLLPKLRGHFAEFLLHESLEHLRLLASPTCVRLRYGRNANSSAKLFLAVCLTTLDGARRPLRHRLSATRYFIPRHYLRPCIGNPPPDGCYAAASLLRVERVHHGTGMLTCFPSPTPFGLGLGSD